MEKKKYKSLRVSFIRGLVLTFLFLIVLCYIAGVNILRLRNDLREIDETYWPTADSSMELRLGFLNKINGINAFLSGNIIEGKEILSKADDRIASDLKHLRNQNIIEKNKIEIVSKLIRQFQRTQENLLISYKKALEHRRISTQTWDELVLEHINIHNKYEEGKIFLKIDELVDSLKDHLLELSPLNYERTIKDFDYEKYYTVDRLIRNHEDFPAIEKSYGQYWQTALLLMANHKKEVVSRMELDRLRGEINVLRKRLERKLKRMEVIARTQMEDFVRHSSLSSNAMIVWIWLLASLAILISIIVARRAWGRIIHPVQALTWATQKVAEEGLDKPLSIKSNDELQILAERFNEMAKTIKEKNNALIAHSKNLKASLVKIEQAKIYTENIMRSMINPLVVLTPEAVVQTVNQTTCNLLGYQERELLGQPANKIFSKKLFSNGPPPKGLIKENFIKNIESTILSKEGRKIPIIFSASAMLDRNDELQGVVCMVQDITERKKAEKEKEMLIGSLKQSEKMEAIGALAGGIAHDFNNILTSIIGFTEITMEQFPPRSETYINLKNVLNSGLRAKDLVNQILTFSRKVEQKDSAIIPFASTIRKELKLIRQIIPSTIEIRQNLDENSVAVKGDLAQIQQMIMNLCINAEHAMREKGGVLEVNLKSVHLDAHFAKSHPSLKEGDYAKLSIRDTGHGMSPSTMERIFDPFYTTKIVGEGTGMGLSSVHGIVSGHEGEIMVQSELGKGTTFDIYLPKLKNIATKEKPQSLDFPGGNENILLVDDEEILVRFGQRLLEGLGYEVVSKTSSIEALEIFKKYPQKFDLVITDQTMPNMTGDVLARELMKIRPEIPVILCTGFSNTISKGEAQTLGIREFIMKPFVKHDMAQLVRKVLDQEKNK